MRNLLRTLLACLLALAGLAPAARAQSAAGQLQNLTPKVHPALWQVSDKDTTIFLFGSIHALPEGVDWYDSTIAAAFEGSDELVTEVTESSPAQLRPKLLGLTVLPKGGNLRAMLSATDRAALEAALADEGVARTGLDRYKPWYAAVALSMLPLMRDGGFMSQQGVEAVLDARARALHHPHSALETADFQLGLFDSLPLPLQERYLRGVVDSLPTLRSDMKDMIREWGLGHADKLAEMMNQEEDDPALMQVLLVNRNKTWAQWIKQRLQRPGKVFIAVGAGHLAGAGSVQEQLRALGIRAERVQ